MAPESSKQAMDLATNGFPKVKHLVMKSNQIATKPKYNKYKTYTDFTDVVANLQSKINVTINDINNFVTQDPKKKMKRNNNEYNTENVIDITDYLLERVHLNLDSAMGVNDASNHMLKNLSTNTIVKVQMGDATLVGARNIVKPQLLFKDRIDNTDSLWMPRLSSKPNSIKQLTVDYVFNEEGKLAGHANPYEVEITAFKPPPHFVNNEKNPSKFPKPKPTQYTPLTMVETESELDKVIEHLKGVHILGVDLEHHSFRTYQGITCLMQISTEEGGDFIIDTLTLREHIHKLNIIFTDPNKIKVFHGAKNDVIWLQRDFGVYVVGLFDTYIAAVVLNKIKKSLKYLVKHYCNYTLDKQHQLTDWRVRPLPDELVEYARCDTHYIIHLYRCMKIDLINEAGGQSDLVNEVFTRGKSVCMQVYQKPVVTDRSHLTLYNFYKKEFNKQQMLCLKLLYAWRDENARIEDESPSYILPNHMLIKVAEALPKDIQSLETYCSPMPSFLKFNIDCVHRIILSCREISMEPVLYKEQTIGSAPPSLMLHEEIHDLDENMIGDEISHGLSLKMIANKVKPQIILYYDQYELDSSNAKDAVKNSTVEENVQLFVPPYHRYKYYRWLSHIQEMREFEEKTARIAAICKDDKYVKTEVLLKLQAAKSDLEKVNRSVNKRGEDTSNLRKGKFTTGNEVDVKSGKNKRNKKQVAHDPESEKAKVKKTDIYNVDNYNMFYTKPKYTRKSRKN